MTDTQLSIEPISASADGKRNAYVVSCPTTGQSLNYAACLNRIKSLDKGDAPGDWNACDKARQEGRCRAAAMRNEEVLAGKSIYFRARAAVATAVEGARQWVSSWGKKPAKPGHRDLLDAIGDTGSFADAISAGDKGSASVPRAALRPAPMPVLKNTGESPLQMALRLKRERNAA